MKKIGNNSTMSMTVPPSARKMPTNGPAPQPPEKRLKHRLLERLKKFISAVRRRTIRKHHASGRGKSGGFVHPAFTAQLQRVVKAAELLDGLIGTPREGEAREALHFETSKLLAMLTGRD